MILDWLKAREELNMCFSVFESIKWGLREDEAKAIICILSETMFEFEGVGM